MRLNLEHRLNVVVNGVETGNELSSVPIARIGIEDLPSSYRSEGVPVHPNVVQLDATKLIQWTCAAEFTHSL